MKKLVLIFAALLFIVCSCSKDEENDEPKSNTELLTAKVWMHDYQMIDSNNNQQPDDEKGENKDISFDFNADGSLGFTYEENLKNLEWEFINNESMIRIIGVMYDSILPPVEQSNHTVFKLDENSLIFFYQSTASHPDVGTFEVFK